LLTAAPSHLELARTHAKEIRCVSEAVGLGTTGQDGRTLGQWNIESLEKGGNTKRTDCIITTVYGFG